MRRGDLVVVVPSRGRPQAVVDLAHAIARTATARTALVVVVDADDPAADDYAALAGTGPDLPGLLCVENTSGPTQALNLAATRYAPGTRALAYLPDDARPVTRGWDTRLLTALDSGHALAQGNDAQTYLHQPRHVVVRSGLVTELGYLVPPVITSTAAWAVVWQRWAMVTAGMGRAEDVVFDGAQLPARELPDRWQVGYPTYAATTLGTDLDRLDAWWARARPGRQIR